MKLTLVSLAAVSLHLLALALPAELPPTPSPSTTVTPIQVGGFPALRPVPQTGQLQDRPSATHFWFVAAGDNRPDSGSTQPETLEKLFILATAKFTPAFFIWGGDIIYGHEYHRAKLEEQYPKFFDKAQLAKVPVFNAPGNHEMDVVDKKPDVTVETPDPKMHEIYLEMMQYPKGGPAYGAFNYGNSRFIALNTEEVGAPPTPTPSVPPGTKLKLDPGWVSQEQIHLLTQDLNANRAKAHIFIFMHHPIMPAKPTSGLNPLVAPKLQALFAQYPNISCVVASHEHLYYNAIGTALTPRPRQDPSPNGPWYLVSGGGGAKLDACPGGTEATCVSSHHFLVFEVDQNKVNVQLVQVK